MKTSQEKTNRSIDEQINRLIYMKGQIDQAVGGMASENPFRMWIQNNVNEMLAMAYNIKTDYTSNTNRLVEVEKLLKIILAVEWDTPQQEIRQRAEDLGDFYKELMKRRNGEK